MNHSFITIKWLSVAKLLPDKDIGQTDHDVICKSWIYNNYVEFVKKELFCLELIISMQGLYILIAWVKDDDNIIIVHYLLLLCITFLNWKCIFNILLIIFISRYRNFYHFIYWLIYYKWWNLWRKYISNH